MEFQRSIDASEIVREIGERKHFLLDDDSESAKLSKRSFNFLARMDWGSREGSGSDLQKEEKRQKAR